MADNIGLRQRQLLDVLLKNKNGLCIDELAKLLSISRNAVQQHIAVLELEGYIQAGALEKTAGRPVRRYILTEAGINSFPKQYGWFSKLMLTDLKEEIGPKAFRDYMFKLGRKLAQSFSYRFAGKTLSEKRMELIKIMEELGYKTLSSSSMDSAEEDAENSLQAYNCIYHDLAQTHQEICQFDIAFITTLLEKDVELTECMAKGCGLCRFNVILD
jgi:DeoR family suf operon transcriptional repressor